MKTEVLRSTAPNALRHAIDVLRHQGLVAFPTDTVYGLGALPFDATAVERLYTAKGRPAEKAIAILVGQPDDLAKVVSELPPMAQTLAQKFWPGPLTLIVPKHPALPDVVSSAGNTVGVRQPDHPIAQKLLQLIGPLAVTSANRSGEPNPLKATDVLAQLNGRIDLLLDGGRVPGGLPSTVLDCTQAQPKVLREGPITLAAIMAALE